MAEIIDTQTLLTRFNRFGLKVPLEELNHISEKLATQLYDDLGYFHRRLFDEVAMKKSKAYYKKQIGPHRTLYIFVKNNHIAMFIRDKETKTLTQYISIKELDRLSKNDRTILNELVRFDGTKDTELIKTAEKLNCYIHVIIDKNETRGSPEKIFGDLDEYQIDDDFEYDIPINSLEK